MSLDSLALTRKNASKDIHDLAEQHLQHDLNDADRDTLKSAASKFGTHATIGSIIGLSLGVFLAFRVRSARNMMFNAYRTVEKPTHVRFADGREGSLIFPVVYISSRTFGFCYHDFATAAWFFES